MPPEITKNYDAAAANAAWAAAVAAIAYFVTSVILTIATIRQLIYTKKSLVANVVAIEKTNKLYEYQITRDFEAKFRTKEFGAVYHALRDKSLRLKGVHPEGLNGTYVEATDVVVHYLDPMEELYFAYQNGLVTLEAIKYNWEYKILKPGGTAILRHVIWKKQKDVGGDTQVYEGYIKLYNLLRDKAEDAIKKECRVWETTELKWTGEH